MISAEQQLQNVAAHAMKITEVKRQFNGKGRSATYVGDVDELASTARQLAEMVQAYLAGELVEIGEATEASPF